MPEITVFLVDRRFILLVLILVCPLVYKLDSTYRRASLSGERLLRREGVEVAQPLRPFP